MSKEEKNNQVAVPEEVRPIFDRLKAKYPLEFEFLSVKGRDFHILTLKDLEPLISGKDIFKEAADFPFWVKIWEASVVMAFFLASLEPNEGQRILELGAGLGVTGLVASSFGHEVTITDYKDEILDFSRVSAGVNKIKKVSFAELDWTRPHDLGKYDVIVGSEVLFHPRFFKPLLNVFKHYLKPEGVIYLAHDVRRKSLAGFLPMCEEQYNIAAQKRTLSSQEETFDILLTRLTPKG